MVLVVYQPGSRFKKIVEGKTREAIHRVEDDPHAMILCGLDEAVDNKVNAILGQVKEEEVMVEDEDSRLRRDMFTNFGKRDKIVIPEKVEKAKVSSKSKDSKVKVPVKVEKIMVDVNGYNESTSECIPPRRGRGRINSIRMG
jgi:hypothetical protein